MMDRTAAVLWPTTTWSSRARFSSARRHITDGTKTQADESKMKIGTSRLERSMGQLLGESRVNPRATAQLLT